MLPHGDDLYLGVALAILVAGAIVATIFLRRFVRRPRVGGAAVAAIVLLVLALEPRRAADVAGRNTVGASDLTDERPRRPPPTALAPAPPAMTRVPIPTTTAPLGPLVGGVARPSSEPPPPTLAPSSPPPPAPPTTVAPVVVPPPVPTTVTVTTEPPDPSPPSSVQP